MPPSAALHEEPAREPVASTARALPAGTRLNGHEVLEALGEGSVAVVYATRDRAHAIAEYMPGRLARRNGDVQVEPRSVLEANAYARGLKAFVDEARMLGRCRHPSLVRIVDLWEANGTAYCVMPRYPSRSLLAVRQGMSEPPDETALRALLDALLGALEALHRSGGSHRKVTPANILLQDDGRPVLLRGGEAGRAILRDELDVRIRSSEPCFAPIEQIVEADAPLDPSVDLYALGGVAQFWMSGRLPPPAFGAAGTARRETVARTVQRLRLTRPRLDYSASLVAALDSALSIYPAERPQSVAEMRARLGPGAPSGIDRVVDVPPTRTALVRQGPKPRRVAMWSGTALTLLALLLVVPGVEPERQLDRVLDLIGLHRGAGAPQSAPKSESVASTAAPATPSTAADAAPGKPAATEASAADSAENGQEAFSASPSAPGVPPVAADAEVAKPRGVEQDATESPNGASASVAPAGIGGAPPAAVATVTPSGGAPSVPSPARTAQRAAPRGPATPREACGVRTQFSLYRCMQMQCSQPRWAANAQCEHLRKTDSVD